MAVITTGQYTITDLYDGLKGEKGDAAVTYSVIAEVSHIQKDLLEKTLTPNGVMFRGFSKVADGKLTEHKGYFVIYEQAPESVTVDEYTELVTRETTIDGKVYVLSEYPYPYVATYTSAAPENKLTYTPEFNAVGLKIEFYRDTSLTELLDIKTIPIVSNGLTPYLHTAYANSVDGTKDFSTEDYIGKEYLGQYTDFLEEDSIKPSDYKWIKTKGETGPQGATGSQGPQGDQGTSVEGVIEWYLATSADKGVTTTTDGWSNSMQPMTTENRYLWNYEEIEFSDGRSQDTIPVITGVHGSTGPQGDTGNTGRSILSIQEHYLASDSTSGVTRTTDGWKTAVQATSESKRYLWNYEEITWSSGTITTYVEPIIIGVHGAKGDTGAKGATGETGPRGAQGVSVESVTENYLASSSSTGVTSTTSGWSETMQEMTATNKYLWNYEVINFSDGTNQPTIPVVIGVYGDKGQTGSTGATGRSITKIEERYLSACW